MGGGGEDVDIFSQFRSGGSGGHPFGQMRGGPGRPAPQKRTMSYDLRCSLEDLYTSAAKKMKVTRKLLNASGGQTPEEKMLTVQLRPYYKVGTKIKYQGEGVWTYA